VGRGDAVDRHLRGDTCLTSADNNGSGTPETLSYTNGGASPQPVVLLVGSYSATNTGDFDLTVNIAPPPANAVCASATAVADGAALTGETAIGATDNLSAACETSAMGGVVYYSLTILPGKTLTATVTPTGVVPWDPVVRLIPSCGATSCVASVDATLAGMAETLTYTNSGATPLNALLAVGSYNASVTGTFNLSISIP
jgi:hypothetical protein